MGAALERTAHSVNIKERLDFSCALFDADAAWSPTPRTCRSTWAPWAPASAPSATATPVLHAGEAFALNNPYAGGTHLPDITVVMPIFIPPPQGGTAKRWRGVSSAEPTFYVAARGHHADIGGVQPGSMPPFSTTIDEEGVMLDALPIMREGRFLEAETRAALAANRWPASRAGPQHRRPQGPDRRLPGRRVRRLRDDPHLRRRGGGPLHDLRAAQRGRRRPPCAGPAQRRRGPRPARRRRRDRGPHHRRCGEGGSHPRLHRQRRPAYDELQRAVGHRRRRGALRVPHPGGRRHPAERRLPGAAEHPDPHRLDAGAAAARGGRRRQRRDQPARGRRALCGPGRPWPTARAR